MPLTIVTQPAAKQSVRRGDIVNLTVVATSDVLYPLSYMWIFKNKTYEANEAPPFVIYNNTTRLAYINTADLTDEQMREIIGVYHRQIYSKYERKFVEVEVTLKDEPAGKPGEEEGLTSFKRLKVLYRGATVRRAANSLHCITLCCKAVLLLCSYISSLCKNKKRRGNKLH